MSPQRFSVGTRFQWRGEDFEIRKLLNGSRLCVTELRTDETQTVTAQQLITSLFAEELQFLIKGQPIGRPTTTGYVDLSSYPDTLREIAEYRLRMISPLLDLSPHARKQAIKTLVRESDGTRRIGERSLLNSFSEASVYRWIAVYEESGRDIRSLIPNTKKRGGKGETRLFSEAEAIISAVISDHYYVRELRTIDFILLEVAARIKDENRQRILNERLKMPSRATVARRIADLDIEHKLVAKRGRSAARRELTQYGSMAYPTLPLERVEIDHTRGDLILVDEEDLLPLGRPTITYCLDMSTRYPLGIYIGFEPPSYRSVMHCLHHAIWPKDNISQTYGTQHEWQAYGIPHVLVVDNGKEFVGRDLEDACSVLGITLQRSPVKSPEFKAGVERMFSTLNTGVFHILPGTTFSNIWQRGDYDSLKMACLGRNDLEKIVHFFLIDDYSERFHRGLNGIPARQWEQAISEGFYPRVPASAEELSILLGRVEYRKVQHYGIDLHGLRYNCLDLASIRTPTGKRVDQKVKIKFNPADLGRIHVFDADDQQYVEVPCVRPEYADELSLWKHEVIRRFARQEVGRVDVDCLIRARHVIQSVVSESQKRVKLATRAKAARWKDGNGHSIGTDSTPRELANPGVNPADALAVPTEISSGLELDLEKLESEGWGLADAPSHADQRKDKS